MSEPVKIIECPRDAWQGLPGHIAPETKADYLRKLIDAGFTHIDAVSFVSPAAVPQMADSEQVLAQLSPPADVEIIGIVVNEKGAQRAIATGAVTNSRLSLFHLAGVSSPQSASNPEESLDVLERVQTHRCRRGP